MLYDDRYVDESIDIMLKSEKPFLGLSIGGRASHL